MGWDSLASSLNLWLNLGRSLNSWQEFQGLGLLGGHGYQAQLPHTLIQLVLSLFIPQQYLRYAFTFLMMSLGGFGSFFLTSYLVKKQLKNIWLTNLLSLLTATIYLLHLATVQTFYVQLEPFVTMFGLLPWTLVSTFTLLKKPTAKKYFWLFVLNFFLSLIGFIPPVFIAYVFFIGIILLTELITKFNKKTFYKILLIAGLILLANFYWLTNVASFTLTQKNDYLDSELNQLTTPEYNLRSDYYGQIKEAALLKSFYFNSYDQNRDGKSDEVSLIMKPWIDHLQNGYPEIIGYILFALFVFGSLSQIFLLIKTKNSQWSLGLIGLIIFAILARRAPGLTYFANLLDSIPVFNQAFRVPFSKIGMSLSLFFAISAASGFMTIFLLIKKISTKLAMLLFLPVICGSLISLIYYSWPSFNGNYLYSGSRISLPSEYLDLFSYLSKQPTNARIAPLPIITTTGWDMHLWQGKPAYTGSGFLWYGIKQPILHRSFDVWSPYNEELQKQVLVAQNNNNAELLKSILDKYDVNYILIDESIYDPSNESSGIVKNDLNSLIATTNYPLIWHNNFLKLYQVKDSIISNNIITPSSYVRTNQINSRSEYDPIYAAGQNYLNSTHEDTTYPFANIFNYTQISEIPNYKLLTDNLAQISFKINNDNKQGQLIFPTLENKLVPFIATINLEGKQVEIELQLAVKLSSKDEATNNQEKISLNLPNEVDHLLININQQPIEIDNNSIQTALVFLKPNEKIVLNALNLNDIENQEMIPDLLFEEELSQINWNQFGLDSISRPLALQNENKEVEIKIIAPYFKMDSQYLSNNQALTCTKDNQGKWTKEYKDKIIYQADNFASSCDLFYPNFLINSDILINLKAKNVSGLPLKIYLKNQEGKLVKKINADKDKTIPIFYQSVDELNRISLLIENRAVDDKKTINELSELTIYQLPLQWLSGIKIEKNVSFNENQVDISKTKKITSGLYFLKTITKTKNSIFALPQAYNNLWLAFARPANKPFLTTDYQLLPHYKYNGWANAWMVPDPGEYEVIIIFWPQLLTFLGYGMLIMTFIYFFFALTPVLRRKKIKE